MGGTDMFVKRYFAILLSIVMMLSLLPAVAGPAFAEGDITTEDQLQTALNAGGTVQLTDNLTLSKALQINNAVTLDLNGKTIERCSCLYGAGDRAGRNGAARERQRGGEELFLRLPDELPGAEQREGRDLPDTAQRTG